MKSMFTAMFLIAVFLTVITAYYGLRRHLLRVRMAKIRAARQARRRARINRRLRAALLRSFNALQKRQILWLEVLNKTDSTHRVTFTLNSGMITCMVHPDWPEARAKLKDLRLNSAGAAHWGDFVLACFACDSPEDVRIKFTAV